MVESANYKRVLGAEKNMTFVNGRQKMSIIGCNLYVKLGGILKWVVCEMDIWVQGGVRIIGGTRGNAGTKAWQSVLERVEGGGRG